MKLKHLFLFLIIFFLLDIVTSDSQTRLSNTIISDDTYGGIIWYDPMYANKSDNLYATTEVSDIASYTQYLKATNYGFNIPNNAIINGIVVVLEKKCKYNTVITYCRDHAVRIVKQGTYGSQNKSKPNNYPTNDTNVTYGSSTDLWGETWTPAIINSANFGVGLRTYIYVKLGGGSNIAYIDTMQITVYYTIPTTTTTTTTTPTPTTTTTTTTPTPTTTTTITVGIMRITYNDLTLIGNHKLCFYQEMNYTDNLTNITAKRYNKIMCFSQEETYNSSNNIQISDSDDVTYFVQVEKTKTDLINSPQSFLENVIWRNLGFIISILIIFAFIIMLVSIFIFRRR